MTPVLFDEPGSSWWPVVWGPVFAAAGAAVEALSGPVHWLAWPLVGLGLAGAAAAWVRGRRRLLRVTLTPVTLTQGPETLAVTRITRVADAGDGDSAGDGDGVEEDAGARVLGGGWTVPRGRTAVGLRLDDGRPALAWARDGEGLRSALRSVITAAN